MPKLVPPPPTLARTLALLLGLTIAFGALQPARAAEKEKSAPRSVTLSSVALPIVVDGKLINYVFCAIRLDLYPNAEESKVRAKEEFFRDDLVRAGHRAPFTRKDDYTRVDEARVRAEVMRFAQSALGPGVVRAVAVARQNSQKLTTLPPPPQTRTQEIIP
jgi:hypothetical protein